jgi:hypothetical protein
MTPRQFGLSLVVILTPLSALAQIQITINASQQVKPISPYIYGANTSTISDATFQRLGGNRWTAYNWENNDSNAGSDYHFQNDSYLSSSTAPGAAVLTAIQTNGAANKATLLTIPINGYVSADRLGNGDVRYPNGDTTKPIIPQSTVLATRFVQEYAAKPGGPASFTLTPSTTDGAVYQDEFVNWVNHQTVAGQQVFYNLDNEPDLWASTHAEVHPAATRYSELVADNVNYATAIKNVSPGAMVFGAVNYGWEGYVNLQSAPDPDSTITNTILNFQASYLKQMHAADMAAGKRLVDVLDMHWYPEAQGTNGVRIINNDTSAATVAARVQAPRSLFDSSYVESSWITRDSLPYQPASTPAPFNTNAIQLIPRVQSVVNQYDPGMKLAISEYQFGAGDSISGGVAQADALGIFGQQGLFAANWWPDGTGASYVKAAFKMYLNYDGNGSKFGSNSVQATSGDLATAAAYASEDPGNPDRMVIVLINRSTSAQTAKLNITNSVPLSILTAYQLTNPSTTILHVAYDAASPQWQWTGANSLSYNMPAMSVTTLELLKAELGDFDLDGQVTAADISAMMKALTDLGAYQAAHAQIGSQMTTIGDFNGDGKVTNADLQRLINRVASGGSGSLGAVPEPETATLLAVGALALGIFFRAKMDVKNWQVPLRPRP